MNYTFQEQVTPLMEAIVDLHNTIGGFLVFILVFVLSIFFSTMISFCYNSVSPRSLVDVELRGLSFDWRNVRHGTLLEVLWTSLPSVVLVLISAPSLALLYDADMLGEDPEITVKVVGHQWYWSYEYPSFFLGWYNLNFASYMVPETELLPGGHRLLDVDHPMYLPIDMPLRLIVTADDVLHSFAVPSLGVKMDAVPGRLNQVCFEILTPGVFYGQCSELCGVNHGFMPIVVVAVDLAFFFDWIMGIERDYTKSFFDPTSVIKNGRDR